MNHLEQLVSEWLQYSGYFVRTAVQVGRRDRGGFDRELDVVAVHLVKQHLLHIECSLDSLSWTKREERFAKKFVQGDQHIKSVFPGVDLPAKIDKIALLQFATAATSQIGGARLITVKQFIREVLDGLEGKSPASGAVPSNLPLLRTLQLAAFAEGEPSSVNCRIVRN
jgi:hypothetical protein